MHPYATAYPPIAQHNEGFYQYGGEYDPIYTPNEYCRQVQGYAEHIGCQNDFGVLGLLMRRKKYLLQRYPKGSHKN
jgi:hypothetical protein